MTPTIGRIVHFRPSADCAKAHGPDPVPAMITAVWSEKLVNLTVFWNDAAPENVRSVEMAAETPPEPLRWYWPPRI